MSTRNEILYGYVLDLDCLRQYPTDELLQRAAEHPTQCLAQAGSQRCGYAVVDSNGKVWPLDQDASAKVVQAVSVSNRQQGLKLRIERELVNGRMVTRQLQETEQDDASAATASQAQTQTTGVTRPY